MKKQMQNRSRTMGRSTIPRRESVLLFNSVEEEVRWLRDGIAMLDERILELEEASQSLYTNTQMVGEEKLHPGRIARIADAGLSRNGVKRNLRMQGRVRRTLDSLSRHEAFRDMIEAITLPEIQPTVMPRESLSRIKTQLQLKKQTTGMVDLSDVLRRLRRKMQWYASRLQRKRDLIHQDEKFDSILASFLKEN